MHILSFAAGFCRGAAAPLAGWLALGKLGRRTEFCVLPALSSLVIAPLCLVAFISLALKLSASLIVYQAWTSTIWIYTFKSLCVAAALVLTAVSTLILQSLLVTFWYSIKLETVERGLGTVHGTLSPLPWYLELRDATVSAAVLLLGNVALLLLPWIPIIGVPLCLVFGWYFNAFYLGVACFDYPLSLRGKRRRAKVRLARANLAYTLGIGSILAAVGWIPIVGSLVFGAAIVGSALFLGSDRS